MFTLHTIVAIIVAISLFVIFAVLLKWICEIASNLRQIQSRFFYEGGCVVIPVSANNTPTYQQQELGLPLPVPVPLDLPTNTEQDAAPSCTPPTQTYFEFETVL